MSLSSDRDQTWSVHIYAGRKQTSLSEREARAEYDRECRLGPDQLIELKHGSAVVATHVPISERRQPGRPRKETSP